MAKANKNAGVIWMYIVDGIRFSHEPGKDCGLFWNYQGGRGRVTELEAWKQNAGNYDIAKFLAECQEASTDRPKDMSVLSVIVAEVKEVDQSGVAPALLDPPVVLDDVQGVKAAVGATALFSGDVSAGLIEAEGYRLIDIELIDPSPFQTGMGRGNPDCDPEVAELAASIKAIGLAEPMIVRRVAGGRYEVIAGHRRLAACRIAGLRAEKCVVRDADDALAEELHVIENLQRKDLSAIEEARSVERMLAAGADGKPKRTVEDVARATGKSVRWVYRRAAITRLTGGWNKAAEKYGLSAAFLEKVGRLPGQVQDEVLQAMEFDEALFARGGDVSVLQEEIEVSLRTMSSAPWAHIPGDPAKCAGCPDRSDAAADLFEEFDGEPRCLNKKCWNRKVDEFVAAATRQAKETHGECIVARSNSAHLYKDKADGNFSVPVVIADGASRGKVMWAQNKEAAAAATGGAPKKGPSQKDLEKAAYIKAVAACISGADIPDWGDGAPAIPQNALAAFACGCGVNAYALVSGVYSGPLQRSLAILERLDAGDGSDASALWKAARPNILKALDIESIGVTSTACETLEAVARKVAGALLVPEKMIEGFVAEFAPKKARSKK